ncbi:MULTISPECIES: flavodoxin [Psychrilyobacter]|uniref:Flavodoxin n=1 Tax=Psychrilyobacter piezotolerans TaxID=2293438 RepID=A0ABX9KLD2_9FUSO|nr:MULTISPECIES: flavodoxin [Psychrilyobacter]MCS5422043.1 flavodoxin [Psychrilyobacter sp. S5]NDI76361.1 flavodoxin [Psychrilyobacter piezotolerans]RDE65959.1 flavodoxin [Psychrilyobacter sp. S5]REI43137.1 flavodoxin [Psychrilyobacter piezotolerans]
MKKIGLFYGTTGGRTTGVVDEFDFNLRDDVEIFDVANGIEKIKEFENLILVTPSYGFGELEAHWEAVIEDFKKIDLSGKTLALVGLGSQTTFGESFVGALEVLYKIIIKNGGKVIGLTSTDGYHFEECEAIVEGKFMGLVLDEENQDDMTPDRIYEWLEVIKSEFN